MNTRKDPITQHEALALAHRTFERAGGAKLPGFRTDYAQREVEDVERVERGEEPLFLSHLGYAFEWESTLSVRLNVTFTIGKGGDANGAYPLAYPHVTINTSGGERGVVEALAFARTLEDVIVVAARMQAVLDDEHIVVLLTDEQKAERAAKRAAREKTLAHVHATARTVDEGAQASRARKGK